MATPRGGLCSPWLGTGTISDSPHPTRGNHKHPCPQQGNKLPCIPLSQKRRCDQRRRPRGQPPGVTWSGRRGIPPVMEKLLQPAEEAAGATTWRATVWRPTQPVVRNGHNFWQSLPNAGLSQPSMFGAGRQAAAFPCHGNITATNGGGRVVHHLARHCQEARTARGQDWAQLWAVSARRGALIKHPFNKGMGS